MTNKTALHSKISPNSPVGIPKLLSYFFPELITAWVLYIGLEIIDFRFIACIDVPSCSTTLAVSNNILHLITKVAEGFSVGMVILCGQHNGAQEYRRTGKILTTGIWMTAFIGGLIALSIYSNAHAIYSFYEVSDFVIDLGVPFLRIRVIGVFFSFIYFVLIGFLRGIKNTQAPMILFLLGALVFLYFDYALIFGAWGFPALGLKGSAIATVLQYAFMLCGALLYIFFSPHHKKYHLSLFSTMSVPHMRELFRISWPVMIDKASIAFCPNLLTKLLGTTARLANLSTGPLLLDSYTVLRIMERIGILPAVAFAQVITFLVSNDYKVHHFKAIKRNIVLVLALATLFVGFSTLLFCLWPTFFLSMLGKEKAYNSYIAYSLPYIAFTIFFDVTQLILSASLRGAADVKTVMWTRVLFTVFFFTPLAYGIAFMPIQNPLLKFVLLYSSAHLNFALMSFVYYLRLRWNTWKKQSIEE
ncbi:MATE family efflux transporter [Candidatus Dependentiae bacterium]|nr:MATE family efflux transporter [Candidatus Dependentiae bacterium]